MPFQYLLAMTYLEGGTTVTKTKEKSKGRGRKMKLNSELIEKIYRLLREGHYDKTVCAALGIATDTYYRWLNDGEAMMENLELPNRKRFGNPSEEYLELCSELYVTVKRAAAEAEMEALKRIRQASREHWQAAAWYLERKFKDRWGRNTTVTVQEVNMKEYADALNATAEDVWAQEEDNDETTETEAKE